MIYNKDCPYIVYFFHAPWCCKCRDFDKKLENNNHIPNIVFTDIETCPNALLNTFKVKALPTFVLVPFNDDEKELGRLESPDTFDELLGWYENLTKGEKENA